MIEDAQSRKIRIRLLVVSGTNFLDEAFGFEEELIRTISRSAETQIWSAEENAMFDRKIDELGRRYSEVLNSEVACIGT
jgi:hypothetical protein